MPPNFQDELMIEAYMGVDLNNPLAVKYNELSLKSFECVSDVLNINVIQCITPDTLFPHLTLSKHKDIIKNMDYRPVLDYLKLVQKSGLVTRSIGY